jgi:hypothetical protein
VKKALIVVVLFGLFASPANSDWFEPRPEFVYARLACTNRDSYIYWNSPDYYPFNPPWHHDYPFADRFFVGLIHELTRVSVTPDSYKIVHLDTPEIFQYPFLYLSEPGFMDLNDKEIANLGEYLHRGGFIMADDFRIPGYLGRGDPDELEVLRHYLQLAAPDYKFERLNSNHPIFHSFYDIPSLEMKPPYGEDFPGFVPEFWGLSDEHGNLRLIANYNNDLGDFWKYLDEGDKPLKESAQAIRMGINYVVYAMSH